MMKKRNFSSFSDNNEDWPKPRSFSSLHKHLNQHLSSQVEVWQLFSQLHSSSSECLKKTFYFNITFFRLTRGHLSLGHFDAINITFIDLLNRNHHSCFFLDKDAPSILLINLQNNQSIDNFIKQSFFEMFSNNQLPLPDQFFEYDNDYNYRLDDNISNKNNGGDSFFLNLHGHVISQNPQQSQNFTLSSSSSICSLNLNILFPNHPIPHNNNGITINPKDISKMFRFFHSHGKINGTLIYQNQTFSVTGLGWFDHEFGGQLKDSIFSLSFQYPILFLRLIIFLDDEREITINYIENTESHDIHESILSLVNADGSTIHYQSLSVSFLSSWISQRTFSSHPIEWDISCPDISLHILNSFPDQETITLVSPPSFWQGCVDVSGFISQQPIKGTGLLICQTAGKFNLSSFFNNVSQSTIQQIDEILPRQPSISQLIHLISGPGLEHYLDDIDIEIFQKTVINPIREYIDRRGKAWRSYIPIAACECVGGDSRKYLSWLATPEIMHCGSLIIDDIQDNSMIRRGGSTCHNIFGQPIAINAGCATYFIAEPRILDLDDSVRVELYEEYFQAVRAAHAGQGFDIIGLSKFLPRLLDTGDSLELISKITAIYRLKTGAPASALARIGAIFGGGSSFQIQILGIFFESIGIAFQIIDDILNLKGMKKTSDPKFLKEVGEDIKEGKITFPIALALGKLSFEKRKEIIELLTGKPTDQNVINYIIETVQSAGAFKEGLLHAQKIVNNAWKDISSHIPCSFYKGMIRSFALFVLGIYIK